MTHRCIEEWELDSALALDARDPRRIELESCPRCRTLLLAYRAFLAGEHIAGSDLAAAERRLADDLEREIATPAPGAGRGRAPWLRALVRPIAARPAWAAAAGVLAVAGALYGAWVAGPGGRTIVLRGAPAPAVTRTALALEPARTIAGGIELRWSAEPGADAYQIAFYAGDLREIARFAPAPDTSRVVRRDELPATLAPGTPLLWRVTALRGGDPVATSEVAGLNAP